MGGSFVLNREDLMERFFDTAGLSADPHFADREL